MPFRPQPLTINSLSRFFEYALFPLQLGRNTVEIAGPYVAIPQAEIFIQQKAIYFLDIPLIFRLLLASTTTLLKNMDSNIALFAGKERRDNFSRDFLNRRSSLDLAQFTGGKHGNTESEHFGIVNMMLAMRLVHSASPQLP